ncbi:ssDNA endodeoxyribonuclease [Lobosporangium transversale]|uniref:Rad1/Rec1/Rad17 n=1 Tax=Lobosporangium transversale TaxID=64571 RepID=A0A1Y2GRV0_9FUNG|nr:Rad1/Rec1/Rad17 [Lobosporangium transversale]KAF9898032.1 ssDNA endodeoxyribonuclease [Lobosporangium transversale]ORZ20889.1 Rad1/Rec1/Rad17 [Lobosporangium transversale]|eukprot:XP_021882798.1 Rad1/Rec1/Rad17 [Lobosporangium transversale]
MPETQCYFTARLRNVRHLAAVLKSVHIKDIATCMITSDGLSFILEESRCLFCRCLIQRQLFEDYKFAIKAGINDGSDEINDPLSQQSLYANTDINTNTNPNINTVANTQQSSQQVGLASSQRMPGGNEPDLVVSFGINLGTLLSCLNMFGTAGWSGTQVGEGNSGQSNTVFGSGPATAVKLSYDGSGSKFILTLEDNGVVTTCGIPTFDPEPPVKVDFGEETAKINMKAQWLEEGLRDLDATSDRVVIRVSPEIPHLRISSLGTVENLDVNYSQGDVIESFEYPFENPTEHSYNFSHVLNVLRVCPMASRASMALNAENFLRIQFLIPVREHRFLYSEYIFAPLETVD